MTLFDAQSDEWARGGFQQMASFMRALRKENADNELASRQLQRELEQQVKLENAKPDGVLQSLLYTKLPPEVRHHVFSYLCIVPESIHIYPVKGNSDQGFRLSRCGESRLNDECGWCNCDTPGQTPPAFFDTQLLLVRWCVGFCDPTNPDRCRRPFAAKHSIYCSCIINSRSLPSTTSPPSATSSRRLWPRSRTSELFAACPTRTRFGHGTASSTLVRGLAVYRNSLYDATWTAISITRPTTKTVSSTRSSLLHSHWRRTSAAQSNRGGSGEQRISWKRL